MFNYKFFLILLSFIYIPSTTYGNDIPKDTLNKIQNLIKLHADTVACKMSPEEAKKIEVFLIDNHNPGFETYYVGWAGDLGCLRGNGTEEYIISKVNAVGNDLSRYGFIVANDDAFQEEKNPQLSNVFDGIESIKHPTIDTFKIISGAHKDANCGEGPGIRLPAALYSYLLISKDYRQSWKIAQKKFLQCTNDIK